MAVNKVVYGGETLVDLTGDTVTEETLLKGVKDAETAYKSTAPHPIIPRKFRIPSDT